MSKYDVIIVGAGPSGIFTAYELIKKRSDLKVLLIEKGRSIEKRICPKRTLKRCVDCKPCSITTGFAGAGAYSDGKLSLSPDVGGELPAILGYNKAQELIDEADQVYLSFGADKNVYGLDQPERISAIRKKAIEASLKLIDCPIRHLGTEEGYRIYSDMQAHLLNEGIEIKFDTMVESLDIQDGVIKGVNVKNVRGEATESFYADKIVIAVGREGSGWFRELCKVSNINTRVGTVDIGVRVEVRDEVMKEINETLYESKLVYYTPTFDDKVRDERAAKYVVAW